MKVDVLTVVLASKGEHRKHLMCSRISLTFKVGAGADPAGADAKAFSICLPKLLFGQTDDNKAFQSIIREYPVDVENLGICCQI